MYDKITLDIPNEADLKVLLSCKDLLHSPGLAIFYDDIPQEISIQLWKINPCYPGTCYPMGDALKEKVTDVLQRVSKMEVFQHLNEGSPWKMGKHLDVSKEEAMAETKKVENICLYCDCFFAQHMQELNSNTFVALPVANTLE